MGSRSGATRSGSCGTVVRTPDPVTAPLVKQAYESILSGGSISDIAREWNAAGAYGLNGKPWSASTVSLFLRKPRNAGLRDHNGEIVGAGTWSPLVDEETWRAVQAVLDAPGRAPGRKTVRKHLLTGVLRCGKPGCGGYLSGMWVMQPTGGKSGRPSTRAARKFAIQPALRGSVSGVGARGGDVALGGGHRFVAQ